MTAHPILLLIASLGLAAVVCPNAAKAAAPGQPCVKIGATSVWDEKGSILACLYDESDAMVWTDLLAHARSASPLSASSNLPSLTNEQDTPPTAPRAHWQGWYAGVDAGLADTTNSYATEGGSPLNIHTYGGSVGLVGGYNHVKSNGLFYGGEADINYTSNTNTSPNAFSNNSNVINSTWDGYATARGRIGVAFDPALVFLTGGLALVDISHKFSGIAHVGGIGGSYVPYGFSSPTIHAGWTAGAGAEFALTDKISLSAQYLRLEMPETTKIATDGNGSSSKFLLDDSANILRVGANWHFD